MNDLAYTSQQYIFRNPALTEPKAASQSMINKLIHDNKKQHNKQLITENKTNRKKEIGYRKGTIWLRRKLNADKCTLERKTGK